MRCAILLLTIFFAQFASAEEIAINLEDCSTLKGSWSGKQCNFSSDSDAARQLCEKRGYTWELAGLEKTYYCHPDSIGRCKQRGGEYTHVCMRGVPFCLIPTNDAGKLCTDSSQCEKGCKYVGHNDVILSKWPWRRVPNEGDYVQGECAPNNYPPLCGGANRTFVKEGKLIYGPVE